MPLRDKPNCPGLSGEEAALTEYRVAPGPLLRLPSRRHGLMLGRALLSPRREHRRTDHPTVRKAGPSRCADGAALPVEDRGFGQARHCFASVGRDATFPAYDTYWYRYLYAGSAYEPDVEAILRKFASGRVLIDAGAISGTGRRERRHLAFRRPSRLRRMTRSSRSSAATSTEKSTMRRSFPRATRRFISAGMAQPVPSPTKAHPCSRWRFATETSRALEPSSLTSKAPRLLPSKVRAGWRRSSSMKTGRVAGCR